jgi:DNA-binding NarL/FixJ family response regulator
MPESAPDESVRYREILTSIVKRFVRLVGASSALGLAGKIPLLSVDDEGNVLSYNQADPLGTITVLIDQYATVFGAAAVNLAQQAAQPLGEDDEQILQEAGLAALPAASPTGILLVDDHALFREGIAQLLNAQPDMTVVGQASTVREAVAKAGSLQPDIVLMDVTLPDGSGLDATHDILSKLPTVKIIFLTVHQDDNQLFAAIRAGAIGYLFKNVRTTELLKTLRSVARGEAGLSGAMARRILDEFSRLPQSPDTSPLTARELEIVQELANGATNREIADKFVISENTVKNHVRNVLSKLHLHSRRDIADYAKSRGLTNRSGKAGGPPGY